MDDLGLMIRNEFGVELHSDTLLTHIDTKLNCSYKVIKTENEIRNSEAVKT